MSELLTTTLITTAFAFLGLFGLFGGFASPSLYLALNTSMLSFAVSIPLSLFLVTQNIFWNNLDTDKQSKAPLKASGHESAHQTGDVTQYVKPYLIARKIDKSEQTPKFDSKSPADRLKPVP